MSGNEVYYSIDQSVDLSEIGGNIYALVGIGTNWIRQIENEIGSRPEQIEQLVNEFTDDMFKSISFDGALEVFCTYFPNVKLLEFNLNWGTSEV